MKKLFTFILTFFILFLFLIWSDVITTRASNITLGGQIINLSDEKINFENIKVDLFRKVTGYSSDYDLIYGLNKIKINVNYLGAYDISNEIDYEYELLVDLSTLPTGYGIMYDNKCINNVFYINKIEYCECVLNGNSLNVVFLDKNYEQLLVNYQIGTLKKYILDDYLYSDLLITANGYSFNKTVNMGKVVNSIQQSLNEFSQLSPNEDNIDTMGTSENIIYTENLSYFNNLFNINIKFFSYSNLDVNENVIDFYINQLNNVILMYDELSFFQNVKENYNNPEYNKIMLNINFNLYDENNNANSSFYSNNTIEYNLNNNIEDIQNQVIICHEFCHFMESLISKSSIKSGSAFDEGLATFMECYYIRYYTNILYDNDYDAISQNKEITRLQSFVNDYSLDYFRILEKNSNGLLQICDDYNKAPYILVSPNFSGYYNYYESFPIFLSIFDVINNETIFFQNIFSFMANYENYENQSKLICEVNNVYGILNREDCIFKLLIESFEISVQLIFDDLFNKFYGNNFENELFKKSEYFFTIEEISKYNIFLESGEILYVPMSATKHNYFSIEFDQEVKISVYNNNELVSSQNAQYLEYLNRYLNLKNCFIKIENINETSVEFNYIYKDIDFLDSEDSEVIVEPNELNYINKYLLLNDIISMYKFELVISDYEGEFNLENILSIKDLNNNYVNAINIEENNENHKIVYFILQPNVTYLVNINLYSLLNDVAFNDVDIILRYCNTPDYQKTIADDYSINEILASNLNGFSLLTYKTYGRYSLIFDVLDKNQILQDFNIKILVSSVTGNVTTYYNSISQDLQSCINYIDIYKGDSVFILYPISSFNSNFLIETNLFYEISKTVTLITDKEGNNSSLLGTEVNLNQGLYESNVITTGFSRCMFLEPNAYSVIRQNYFWFSTNDEVAEVSNFGTVLAKKAGVTIIYCIYKYDFTVIGMYRILVVEDNDSNSVYLNYGLDVRNNGDSSGTEVDLNGGIKYSIGNHTEIITIGEGYTRYICLGNDSPSQILQHFVWESNSECVYVSQFGTILGMKKSDEYCTITGTYKFNSKFKVIINISVE